jgi:hypothetical protein
MRHRLDEHTGSVENANLRNKYDLEKRNGSDSIFLTGPCGEKSGLRIAAYYAGCSSFTRACGPLPFYILVALVETSRMLGFLGFVDL